MKKMLSLFSALAFSALAFAQSDTAPATATPKAPDKDIISAFRIHVKPGHDKAFRAALTAHAQKFHTGDVRWRVGEIMSGPDGGGYQIVEGPTSWTALDDRGDLGADHQADFDQNITPHIERISSDSYAAFQEELSCVKMEQWSNKVMSMHYYVRPGRGALAYDVLKRFKALWEKRGLNVAVWASRFSGPTQYTAAFRLKNGWKDFDLDGISNREAANALWGSAAFDGLMADMAQAFEKVSSELVNYDPALGSK